MRLGPQTKNWPHKNERAVANFDEDAVTMAVAAAAGCLRGWERDQVEALYVASTSLPYIEKQSASLVATATDLRTSMVTADVAHSLRSGTLALRMALDGVAAGSVRQALVVASDMRPTAPGSDLEREGGDAAAAFLVGDGPVIANVVASHSLVNDILDVWRSDGDGMLRSTPEEHFRYEEGYLFAVTTCVEQLLAKTGRKIEDFQLVALSAPDSRRRAEAVRRLGLSPGQAVAAPEGVGSTGSADGLIQLIAALERASPSESILLVNYGDGADAWILETTAALSTARQASRGLTGQLANPVPLVDYLDFLRWRGMGPPSHNGARMAPAPHALYREQAEVMRMRGMRCGACGMVQYPPQRVCVRCKAKDNAEPVRIADGGGTLFSYSMDYVATTPDVPLLHGVVDFDLGGRAMMMVTDRDLDAVRIGMKLDLTFRKFLEADGIHAYLWKAAPAR
jgi:3-hydroxy-3-methylglutaryl CoA synthase